jgi:hypothetical protein
METGWGLTALVEAIRAGDVVIKPGHSLPILRDATTHMAVKRSGKAIVGQDAREWSNTEFQQRYADNFDAIWDAITHCAVVKGDPRAMKLLVEHGQGRSKDAPLGGNDALMQMLLERVMAEGPYMSNLTFESQQAASIEVRDVSDEVEVLQNGQT